MAAAFFLLDLFSFFVGVCGGFVTHFYAACLLLDGPLGMRVMGRMGHPCDRQSQVDLLKPDLARFPRFAEARGMSCEVRHSA
jgi:hypothetical protein